MTKPYQKMKDKKNGHTSTKNESQTPISKSTKATVRSSEQKSKYEMSL